jgi:hypothetical protein
VGARAILQLLAVGEQHADGAIAAALLDVVQKW